MHIISSSEARSHLAAIIDKVQHEPVTIQKQGKDAAVLISCEEFDRLTNAQMRAFQAVCDDVGAKASARGLTEEKLMALLVKNDKI